MTELPSHRRREDAPLDNQGKLFNVRDLRTAQEEAADHVADAKREHCPVKTFLLLSGGNDSMVLLDRCAHECDAVVHVNTGIGIQDTSEFVHEQCRVRKLRLIEMAPPVPYDQLVLDPQRWNGFPGNHTFAYGNLKGEAIRQVARAAKRTKRDRVLFLTGLRRAESERRKRLYTPIDVRGSQVWVNPLFSWSNEEMHEYRKATRLPQNPVSATMHMSGECLCGSRARKGEREEWEFFYPTFIRTRIEPLEAEARRRGLKYPRWGWIHEVPPQRRPEIEGQGSFMPMCVGCTGTTDDDDA